MVTKEVDDESFFHFFGSCAREDVENMDDDEEAD